MKTTWPRRRGDAHTYHVSVGQIRPVVALAERLLGADEQQHAPGANNGNKEHERAAQGIPSLRGGTRGQRRGGG